MKNILFTFFILPYLHCDKPITLTPANKMMQENKAPYKISQVSRGGALITLENGDKYVVRKSDREISGGWLLPSKVKLYKTEDPKVFILKNLSTNAQVRVSPY